MSQLHIPMEYSSNFIDIQFDTRLIPTRIRLGEDSGG